jgi:hypothetical protein
LAESSQPHTEIIVQGRLLRRTTNYYWWCMCRLIDVNHLLPRHFWEEGSIKQCYFICILSKAKKSVRALNSIISTHTKVDAL